jgi:23S rRNA pseudouridine1911/1915/1917 synthase
MKKFTVYHIEKDQDQMTIEIYLKQVLQYSGRKLQKLTRQKGILLNGKPAFLQKNLKFGDVLSIKQLEDNSYGVVPEEGLVDILYEDKYMFVLNKHPYQLVHPSGQTTNGTLANYLAHDLQQRNIMAAIRPLHRLDRNTSGCIVFAKDAQSQSLLEQQLKAKTLERTYMALVKGVVESESGRIDAPIGKHPTKANRRAVRNNGDDAITVYKTIARYEDASLLELQLLTGRTHQIRVHLAHIGHPILGDGMYGTRSSVIGRQALHAVSIAFKELERQQKITVEAPLPKDFQEALAFFAGKE